MTRLDQSSIVIVGGEQFGLSLLENLFESKLVTL